MNWLRDKLFPFKAELLLRVCSRIESKASFRPISGSDILLLASAWGNLGYAAGLSYLRHVGRHTATSAGAVLECGSGATTLLIGALTKQTGRQFVVLEHDKVWYDYLCRNLEYLDYSHVTLLHTPLIDYRSYHWYQIPQDLVVDQISLVICDGPPGSNPGGRYGLLPTMMEHLADDCVILMDDAHRRAEQRIIDAWTECRCLKANRIGRFGTHAEVVLC
jgi:hypothetical protein